jgi:hypothetical protein
MLPSVSRSTSLVVLVAHASDVPAIGAKSALPLNATSSAGLSLV